MLYTVWNRFGFSASIGEEYVLLAAVLRVVVALKCMWDISSQQTVESCVMSGKEA